MSSSPLRTFILASGSPRRKELLERLGLSFTVQPANIDESRLPSEAPEKYVERLSLSKARAVSGPLVLAADTTVAVDNDVLGKPHDADEAKEMLRRLSGRSHSVFTAVATQSDVRVVQTRVWFKRLSASEMEWYAKTPEPYDKAGGYGLQGLAAAFVERLEGSPTNVIGLPLPETLQLLHKAGLQLPW
jgi:septum formation protein